jgi:hypothetical protein
MGLETATYITDLNSGYPEFDDQLREADDHMRLIKAVLKATFPVANGAIPITGDGSNLIIDGSFLVTGLVDGRDVAADGTAQDAHIADASLHYTMASISITISQISDFGSYATSAQGTLADTAVQPGDNVSVLVNDSGYLTSETSHADVLVDGDFGSNGIMVRTAAGVYSIVADASADWNTAFGWGDHALAGYMTALAVSDITDQPAAGAVVGTDTLLINDGGVLSEVTADQLKTFMVPSQEYHTATATPLTSGSLPIATTNDQIHITRSGNLVHVQGALTVGTPSSPLGDIRWDITPYVNATLNEDADLVTCVVFLRNLNTLPDGMYWGEMAPGSGGIIILNSDYTTISPSEFVANALLYFNFSYVTDAA